MFGDTKDLASCIMRDAISISDRDSSFEVRQAQSFSDEMEHFDISTSYMSDAIFCDGQGIAGQEFVETTDGANEKLSKNVDRLRHRIQRLLDERDLLNMSSVEIANERDQMKINQRRMKAEMEALRSQIAAMEEERAGLLEKIDILRRQNKEYKDDKCRLQRTLTKYVLNGERESTATKFSFLANKWL